MRFLITPLLTIYVFAGHTQVNWDRAANWSAIIEKARLYNKYIFVDAYTTWCGPCKLMDRDVYTNKEIGDTMNTRFISVKMQMDTTELDDDHIKQCRSAAQTIKNDAKITAYPSLLFYSPDGELLYKLVGYRDTAAFINEVKFALDPARKEFRKQLADYESGIKDYFRMGDLAITVKQLLDDKVLALSIAKDYTNNYLDKLDTAVLLTKGNLDFIENNGWTKLITLNSKFFAIAYYQAKRMDSVFGRNGVANEYVTSVISDNVIQPILQNKRLNNQKPNWRSIYQFIRKKYPAVQVGKLILDEKVRFYRTAENWNLYSKYKSKSIKNYPVKSGGWDIFWGVNGAAWDVFLHSENKRSLKRALTWSILSIKLEPNSLQYWDTKANLLYKLGRIKQAINIQQEAINRGGGTDIMENLDKMKKGIKTW